jgi:phosphonate transport system substrate-binding protein
MRALAILALILASLTAAAHAGWREDTKVLRIGVLAGADPSATRAHLESFRAYLEARIGLPVELVPSYTMAGVIESETSARVSYAILSASGYATAAEMCHCVEPLAVPTAFDGARGFYAVMLARSGSPIRALPDTSGARLALGAQDSVAGRLLPMKAFAAAGIDPETHFAALYEAPGPVEAIRALIDGRADVALAWSSLTGDASTGYDFGPLTTMVADGSLAMDQVQIVWQSPLIPFGPHTVRTDMPAELRTLLGDALTAMAVEAPDVLDAVDSSAFGGGGFVAASAADYAPLADLVAATATTAPAVTDAAPAAPASPEPTVTPPAIPEESKDVSPATTVP